MVTWLVRTRGREWKEFPEELAARTEENYQLWRKYGQHNAMSYNWHGVEYHIHFDLMLQVNTETDYKRAIKRFVEED